MKRRRAEDFYRQTSLFPANSDIPQATRVEPKPEEETGPSDESANTEESCKLCEAWGPGNCPRHQFEYR